MHTSNHTHGLPPRQKHNKARTKTAASITLAAMLLSALSQAQANEYSPTLFGPLGLNTIPSARMAESGTLSAGISTLDPYTHAFIGLQIAKPLYIGMRQSAEVSNITKDANRLYPGIDLKLRLWEETRSRPALVIGLQSALGHKRTAGEYIALSKRHKSLDFTLGAGWGRFGSAGHIDNPLKTILPHFGKNRALDGELANTPDDWFTGAQIGFFGGIEYFTPYDGLSIKADWGADRYEAEQTAFNYNAPAPWGISANYKPTDSINLNLGVQGTEKIMGRLSLSTLPSTWNLNNKPRKTAQLFRHFRTNTASTTAMKNAANADKLILHNIKKSQYTATAHLPIKHTKSAPAQFGRALRAMANHGGATIEELEIIPTVYNLHGPAIRIMRKDLENTLSKKQGSPEEIWQNTEFKTKKSQPNQTQPYRWANGLYHEYIPEITLENQTSISEEDQGTLTRTALIAGTKFSGFYGLLTGGASLRLNLHNNLKGIAKTRRPALLPVRSNVADFADTRLSLETLYATYTNSLTPSTHIALTNGLLEEMYSGFGGEILYRPFTSKFAIGAETWIAAKRDPDSFLHATPSGDVVLTGHLNGWYDLPEHNLTLNTKIGRYLGGDIGATFGLNKTFQNGTKLNSEITLTNLADTDIFGGTTHAYGGLSLSIPLGQIKHVPEGTKIHLKTAPFARDAGQYLNNPMPLYALTEPLSYRHIIENWGDVVE